MRIGHVTTHYLPVTGGQQSYIADLLRVLSAAGHSNRIYQWDTGVDDPSIRAVPRPPRWLLGLREGAQYWLFDALLPLRFADLAGEDLLIVHFPFHYPAVAWHPRVVVLSHGVEWDQPARRLPHRLRRSVARLAWASARVVIANDSNFVREMGLAIAPASCAFAEVAPRRWLIPNAVDIDHFRPSPPIAALAALEPVLVPRNLWPARGIHVAIEAFARLAAARPAAHLLIAGDFWDLGYKDELMRRISAHSLHGRVLFLGPYPWRRMPSLYSSARVTLVPSLRSEGTSLAALESMACGTPVVTTDVGGLADLPTAHAAPDATALAHRLGEVLDRRDAVAAEQRRAVHAGFALDRWTNAWQAAIAQAAP